MKIQFHQNRAKRAILFFVSIFFGFFHCDSVAQIPTVVKADTSFQPGLLARIYPLKDTELRKVTEF
jgi:hypothetical protein